jgi:hypothetical protein
MHEMTLRHKGAACTQAYHKPAHITSQIKLNSSCHMMPNHIHTLHSAILTCVWLAEVCAEKVRDSGMYS